MDKTKREEGVSKRRPSKAGADKKIRVEEVEDLLNDLKGVLGAKLVVDSWGAIKEVHILATSRRHPKQIVRDVESSLAAKWGLDVDHKKVSVAQLKGEVGPPMKTRAELAQIRLNSDLEAEAAEMEVELLTERDERVSGSAVGQNTPLGIKQATGEAVVEAMNRCLQEEFQLYFEKAQVFEMEDKRVAVCLLSAKCNDGSEIILTGSRLVAKDDVEAVAQACLEAGGFVDKIHWREDTLIKNL